MPGKTFGQLTKPACFGKTQVEASRDVPDGFSTKIIIDFSYISQEDAKSCSEASSCELLFIGSAQSALLSGFFDGVTVRSPILFNFQDEDCCNECRDEIDCFIHLFHSNQFSTSKFSLTDHFSGVSGVAIETIPYCCTLSESELMSPDAFADHMVRNISTVCFVNN